MAKRRNTRARAAHAGSRGLSGTPTDQLRRELSKRSRRLPGLRRRLDGLRARVAELEVEIASLGGDGGVSASGGRKRPKNDLTLVDALHKLLKGQRMTVTQATAEVQKAGYRTSAENFRTIVNQTLIRFKNRFKKLSRGVYTST
ncbi:MAG: hypothetical protein FJ255_01440 [Phycisphaerae bacterium]|nr:hypothetical protein [Phycisphaerae bacterium]